MHNVNQINTVRRKALGDLTPYYLRLTIYNRNKDLVRREKKVDHGS